MLTEVVVTSKLACRFSTFVSLFPTVFVVTVGFSSSNEDVGEKSNGSAQFGSILESHS